MPRKRRTFYPKRQRRPAADRRSSGDPMVDAEATRLADSFELDQLQGMLLQAQQAYDNADRLSQEQPGPQALREYRSAEKTLAATQRAVAIASEPLD